MPKNNSSRKRASRRASRHLSVRGVLRRDPNLEKVARSMAALALAQAEKAAEESHRTPGSQS